MKFPDIKKFNEALEKKFNKGFQDGYKGTSELENISGLFKYVYLAGHREGQKIRTRIK